MELRDYLNVIRVRKGVIVLATLAVALVALAVSLLQPKSYSADAKVLVTEKDTGAAIFGTILPELSSQPERALQTQVQLVEVRPVAEATIKRLGLKITPEQLLGQVTVGGVGQTNIVLITAAASDPQQAADIANTMAEEYVVASRERKRESVAVAADEVQQRLDEARNQILELGSKIQTEGKSNELSVELQMLTDTYSTLAEKLEQLRINEKLESGSGSVVQNAVPNEGAVSPKPLRNVILGAIVGLIFGTAMAFLYEYLDNTIKSTEEAEAIYGGPVLGIVPVERFDKGVKRQLTIFDQPGSAAAESYRVIRNSMDFINFEHDMKTIMVTSAIPSEGKSTVAANLAASLSQAGKKVVLMSCDFRRPTTDQFFNVNNVIGLSDVLLGTHSLKAALQQPANDHLLLLTAGKMPPNPSELLASTRMREIIDSLEEWADWVIIDSAPVLAVADPISVARWVDAVLMVSKASESTREAGTKAVELLGKVGARIAGVVIWGLDETRNKPGYGYGYGYYAGGYYYQKSDYGNAVPSKRAADGGMGNWAPPQSPGRKVAGVVVRILKVVLLVLVFIALLATVLYFLAQYIGWDLQGTLGALF